MADLYLTDTGDLAVNANGDIAMVPDEFRDMSQQAYIRMSTAIGEWALYPQLGADLEELIGMPNTPETAELGKSMILDALQREGVFSNGALTVTAVPLSHQSIRFDVFITSGSRTEMILSIEQNLTMSDSSILEP